MDISLVITNWNGKELLKETLPTFIEASESDKENSYEIILIDDSSTDDSVDFVRKTYPEIKVFVTPENVGYIEASNYGVSRASSPYVMFLNSDMKLSPDTVKLLSRHINNEGVFAVTPSVFDWEQKFQYGNRGGFFRLGHIFQYEKPINDTKTQSFFACGGAFLFKKDVYQELGGYDNNLFYPYYYEEIDICYRALKRGYKIIYEPEARVYHKIRGTISRDRLFHEVRIISGRNSYLFSWKNITDFDKVISMIFFQPLFLIRDLFLLRFRFWKCFFRALPLLPLVLKKRKEEKKYFKLTDRKIFQKIKGS
ncbi:MAG: glycosyltransferase [Candidatus Aureabacteria bacterium]|nr:glycosyltransferase [Candidatus Auribacterota bacterium]